MSIQKKRPCVGVIGSGTEEHPQLSEPLGRWLAEQECDLINGGGAGVMKAVSQAFGEVSDRKGSVIGVIPASASCDSPAARSAYAPLQGYPNSWVDIPIYTHLPLSGVSGKDIASRNHIIILSADVIVAFPGGAGTRSEIQLALEYRKPLLILNPNHEWDELKNTQTSMAEKPEEAIQWLAKNISKIG
jgi:predicted Rossmann-fold nucleotide-binding protein